MLEQHSSSQATRNLLLVAPAIVVLVLLVVIPLGIMAYVSLLARGEGSGVNWSSNISGAAYLSFFVEEDFDGSLVPNYSYLLSFLRSIAQAIFTTAICILLGVPMAMWMAGLDTKWRSLMVLVVTIPFWTSLLIRNYAWLIILRQDGWAQEFVNAILPAEWKVSLLYNDFAVAVGLAYSFLPFMILPVFSTLEKFDWRLLEAAYDLGANKWRAIRNVVLPISMPGIVAGSLLVFIPSLGSFITPALLGGGKTLMIGNLIYLQFTSSRNWPFGAALSMILLGLMFVCIAVLALRQKRNAAVSGRKRAK